MDFARPPTDAPGAGDAGGSDQGDVPKMTGWTMGIDGWLWTGAWILALVISVGLLVWPPRHRSTGDKPIDILRSRLARGEIRPEEFERARSLLDQKDKGGRPMSPADDRKVRP